MQYLSQSGESLIELMLALSLSLFIFAGAFELLAMAKQEMQYQLIKNTLMQEAFISEYQLQEAIENTGLSACGQVGSLLSFKNLASDRAGRVKLRQGTSVQIFHIDQVPSLDLKKAGSGQATNNTDVLIVRKLSKQSILEQAVSKNTRNLILPKAFNIKAGNVLIVSDCQHLVADKVLEVKGQKIQLAFPLYFHFKQGSFVGQFDFEAYYAGKTLRSNNAGKRILALYMQDSQGIRHELVPDVTEFKLQSFSHAIEVKIKLQSEDAKMSESNSMLLTWQ
jgi:hypothetical protein